MSRIVVSQFITVDGVVEDPGGSEDHPHGGWHFRFNDPAGGKYKLDELQQHDALLLGRVTYDGFAAAWPDREDEAGYADKMNSLPKFVVSSTLTDPTWNNTTVLEGDAADAVRKLRDEDHGNVLIFGSVQLVQTLIQADLIDEYRLMIDPIVLGSGKGLFPDSAPDALELKLVSAQPLESGTVILTYEPKR